MLLKGKISGSEVTERSVTKNVIREGEDDDVYSTAQTAKLQGEKNLRN